MSNAATEVTITDNIAYPIGTEINLINSDGQTTISAPSGGTLNGDTNDVTIQVAYGQATLKKIASDNYVIYGDLA